MLSNRRYIGELRLRDVVQPNAIPALVSGELVGARPLHLAAQDRSVTQKPHWGFCCFANVNLLCKQNSRQFPSFFCVHQPDGFKDLFAGDFCCRRLFILPGLRCCRGQLLGAEVRFDLLGQFQLWLVEALLVHPDAGVDAQYPEILRVVAQTETLAKRERAGRCQPS